MRDSLPTYHLLLLLPTLATASEAQNKDRAWLQYYKGAELHGDAQWKRDIWPRIGMANFSRVLEIAPGGGRLTDRLLHAMRPGDKLVGVEKNRVAVETLLRKRFATHAEDNPRAKKVATFHINNGSTLQMIPDASISFVFSWDSMVHFAPEDVASYIVEIYRVLRPGGTGFLHHSNLPQCKGKAARGRAHGPDGSCGVPVLARKNPHGRNLMTCDIFAKLARSAGLEMTASEKFLWPPEKEKRALRGVKVISDCVSSFRKPCPSAAPKC